MNFDNFEKIKTINPDIENTWCRNFLTFDIDWAADEILADTMSLVAEKNIKVTWFVTHGSPTVSKIRENNAWEMGLHPNFNQLLNGEKRGSADEILADLFQIVPSATSIRSHSLVQSSRLGQLFVNSGITHESNDYIPSHCVNEVKPYRLENGLIKIPYIFSDELWCLSEHNQTDFLSLTQRSGLRVFNFHPIHVYLNTECLQRYERTREFHHNPEKLIRHRYSGYGTRSRLIDLLNEAKDQ